MNWVMAGALCGPRSLIHDVFGPTLRTAGMTLAPFNAWVVLKGLDTLALRAAQQAQNAMTVGKYLEARVPRILHPGLASHPQYDLAQRQMILPGSVFSFEVAGGRQAAHAILDALELIDISNHFGDTKSLMCHPASTTHSSLSEEVRLDMGVTQGLLRISVGLEDPADLIEDLDQALRSAGI